MGQPTNAAVLTVSDGVYEGSREDTSGRAVADLLEGAGYRVLRRDAVPDDRAEIERALRSLAAEAALVVTTGGTGLGPRDVTPEATRAIVDREVPGLGEAMRAAGRATTPMADLSRGLVGAAGSALILNLPGSARGAVESLEAVLPILGHALEVLAGRTEHPPGDGASGATASSGVAEPVPPAEGRDHRAAAQDGGDAVLEELARHTSSGQPVVLATAVRVEGSPPCRPGHKLLVGESGPVAGTLGCAEFDGGASTDARSLLAAGEPAVRRYDHELGSIEVYLEPHRPGPRLLVVGATPVALWLLRWAPDLGYATTLVEPRRERVTPDHRRAAGRVVEDVAHVSVDDRVDAVHTDHDAPLAAEHLAALVRGGARFVGVMGSARHAGAHLEALREMGLSDDELARLRTPVGLDIGARTPQEIALSILAGLVAARAGRGGGWLDERSPVR